MEAYLRPQRGRALRFFSAWTTTLHALGYSFGIHSSSASGVADLAGQFGRGKYVMPDVIFDALWNSQADTRDSVFSPGEWVDHHRLHQYRGNLTRTYGDTTMDIDRDYLDVNLSSPAPGPSPSPSPSPAPTQPSWTPGSSQAVTQADGTVDVFYRGRDDGLWCLRYVPAEAWSRPVSLGGRLASAPSAVAVGNGGVRVFYQGSDGHLWQVRSKPDGWSQPWALTWMGVLGSRPLAVADPGGVAAGEFRKRHTPSPANRRPHVVAQVGDVSTWTQPGPLAARSP